MNKQKKSSRLDPMVTFCSARKLSSYLVRAKFYYLKRMTGSCKSNGKRCAYA